MDDAWTTGGDANLEHIRFIAVGGFAQVHELSNKVTKEIFARNLLQPGRELTLKEIQNEIRAVEKVCLAENPHPNIVKVLRHGTFPMTRHICLDLELCEFTLECYIKERLWKPTSEEIADAAGEQGGPKLELLTRTRYIWAIMFQVASGLEFIHGLKEVHRDLKPRNVLYSRQEHVWKLADFGISTEGTTSMALTTALSRGTSGYRAPELFGQDKAMFTNKVDIFATGCILFEMAFRKKLFETDHALLGYVYRNEKLNFPISTKALDKRTKDEIDKITMAIYPTVDHSPRKRPSAKDLRATCVKAASALEWQKGWGLAKSKLNSNRKINLRQPFLGFKDSTLDTKDTMPVDLGFRWAWQCLFENEITKAKPWQLRLDELTRHWTLIDWEMGNGNDLIALVFYKPIQTPADSLGYYAIVLQDVQSGIPLFQHQFRTSIPGNLAFAFSPDGKYFGCHHDEIDTIYIFDLENYHRVDLTLSTRGPRLRLALFTFETCAVIDIREGVSSSHGYTLYVYHKSGDIMIIEAPSRT